jgi:hypothetical protein
MYGVTELERGGEAGIAAHAIKNIDVGLTKLQVSCRADAKA